MIYCHIDLVSPAQENLIRWLLSWETCISDCVLSCKEWQAAKRYCPKSAVEAHTLGRMRKRVSGVCLENLLAQGS
jgi:hypothetical protein